MQIDRQKAVDEVGTGDLHAVGEKEDALELPRGDATVQIDALPVVDLPPPDEELPLLDQDLEIVAGKACDGQRDPERFGRKASELAIRSMLQGG